MIKRTESNSSSEARRRRTKKRKRRLMMEGLEDRRLLAVGPGPVLTLPPGFEMPEYGEPRNIGTVQAFTFSESESAIGFGVNDTSQTADFVPLGTGPGQEDTIDINGSMGLTVGGQGVFNADVDVYAFDLKAGDVLDIALQGAAGNISVLYDDGSLWFGTDTNQGVLHGSNSPLMTTGNAVAAQVVPEDGRYYLFLAPSTTTNTYTVGLRAYRPVSESLPIGTQQVLYLDFDGGFYPTTLFPSALPTLGLGVVRFSSLRENLPLLGLDNITEAKFNELLDKSIAQVESDYATVARNGTNGDYDSSGTAGEYGITVLNSRDHADPGFNNPLVTRLIIGGTIAEAGITGILGIAQSLDIGNFTMNENAIVPIDFFLPASTLFPISPAASILDAIARRIGTTTSHEAGHTFGLRHTNGDNLVGEIMDGPGINRDNFRLGIGNDGIFGTADDTESEFVDSDQFSLVEGMFGYERLAPALSWVLSTGTVGGSVSGTVFNDLNSNGAQGVSEPGLAGVTVFADLNGNGELDPTDPTTTTAADGTYSLGVAPGTCDIMAITPPQFTPTTPSEESVTVSLGSVITGVDFGFNKIVADITGTKWADVDGDGEFDADESGLAGVYIYLDLDGDDRPDLGEPGDVTDEDGTYSLDFPGPGDYTVREVVEPGFIQTFPREEDGFEHNIFFDGISLHDNLDFGNLPSRDFGDAPDTYKTTLAAGGPSHGITAGLTIGEVVDRELDGQPTTDAQGDDENGRVLFTGVIEDDEDGLRLLDPLGPGASADFEVTLTNTSGSPGFLQAWMDFNGNGSFEDPGEKFVSDLVLESGVHRLPVTVPAGAAVGTSYVRLRYSQTSGLGVGGDADTGEVEDYSFPILEAAKVANDDVEFVSRNSQANVLDVLDNDFQTVDNQLTIVQRDLSGTRGRVEIINDGKFISYTPPTGFIGRDEFGYTVRNEFGQESSARVVVNVTFQSADPIAIDDTFDVPEGATNWPLNVLGNDIPSIAGGISIVSVTPAFRPSPDEPPTGGSLNIDGGGLSLRYNPLPGFNGTEQFGYTIQDANGRFSSAIITINVQPGARQDDIVDYSIGFFDVVNDAPIENVSVGDVFNVRVFVDDLRNPIAGDPEGVFSAFLDLLYTDTLVATIDSDPSSPPPFDISFGPLFSGGNVFQQGSADTPGVLDEIGGTQPIDAQMEHSGPVELLTVTMQAVSPGVAVFQADPADVTQSETIVLGQDRALEVKELRLGNAELEILPEGTVFSSAIDDSFPDGLDSNGDPIKRPDASAARLDVLDNDILGLTGTITEFGLVTAASQGNAEINDNGTPFDFNDDYIDYTANFNANGFDSFRYLIVTAEGIRSTAEVSLAVGNADDDDLIGISLNLVNADGSDNPTGTVAPGSRFGVQVIVDDLRPGIDEEFVFAAFLDVMYDSGIIAPANTIGGDAFDFDVEFAPDFNEMAAVGTAARAGIIDEFGTLMKQNIAESGNVDDPNLMATLFFNAVGSGSTRIVGGPADNLPFQDSLLFREDNPVPIDQIRYDVLDITVGGSAEPEALHNFSMPGDVNNDGDVSPIDALLVINYLGRTRVESEEVDSEPVFLDVSGDGVASGVDALMVINSLRQRQLAESELLVAPPVSASQSSVGSSSSDSDAAFADLSESALAGDAAVAANNARAAVINPVDLDSSSDSEDDDDVLGLLADDVSGLWS